MRADSILWPVFALALWTVLVLMLIPVARFGAARKRQVRAEDFRFGESQRVPPEVSIPNRNYMNLLELPLLFYVVCIILYASAGATLAAVVLAWTFVALRVAHSFIHLGYNNVMHRLGVFAVSNVVLIALWVVAAVEVAGGG